MLIKRFALAKKTRGKFDTPLLLRCGQDIEIDDKEFRMMEYTIKKGINYPASLFQKEIKIAENIYLVPNGNTLLRNTREFVDYTFKIREKYGYGTLFYIPGVPPNLIPVLFYLGYDIFDDCMERLQSYAPWGESNRQITTTNHIFELTKAAFDDEMLREFVEGIPYNKSQEILRYTDYRYFEKLEVFYPIHKEKLNAVSANSLNRPDVRRWLGRLKERYIRPKYGKYLLLLPCSARKPYSLSKSHRLMRKYIKSTMHEVILTSPLGLVPRELESFYPAKNYDIPVIGKWYEEEKKMIRDILQWLLEKYPYERIISFLPKSMDFLEDILREQGAITIWNGDLEELARATKELDYRVSKGKMLRNNLESLAMFQFNHTFNFSNAKIQGRYPRIDIRIEGERFFGYDMNRGMLTLAKQSAEILAKNGKYSVEIDDFYPEGDVFAAGILNATRDIREGDEVSVIHDKDLRGWGIARMNYHDMINEEKGKAVKIRGKNQ